MLKEHTELMQRGQLVKDGEFDHAAHKAMEGRMSSLIQKMSGDLTDESRRIGCWGVLGQGTGGQLIMPGTKTPASKADLLGEFCQIYGLHYFITLTLANLVHLLI